MANTIAQAIGNDLYRSKKVNRLGSKSVEVSAATWETFVHARVLADGSGYVAITRHGKLIHNFTFGPETEED